MDKAKIVRGPRQGGPTRGRRGDSPADPLTRIQPENCDSASGELVYAEQFELRPCGCGSWFCGRCAETLGRRLRTRLTRAVRQWSGVIMWTLTVDPELFDSPADAMRYLRENRCIARLVRELRRKGLLADTQWFSVTEFHRNGWPHFHLLVEAKFIPIEDVKVIWNRFRPEWAGPVEAGRPGFGALRFSAPKFASAEHAANYACKYLTKMPRDGFPDWVLDGEDRFHRYNVSRGFWKAAGEVVKPRKEPGPHPAGCVCDGCTAVDVMSGVPILAEEETQDVHCEGCRCDPCKRKRGLYRSHRERIEACCGKGVLVKRITNLVAEAGERVTFAFVSNLAGEWRILVSLISKSGAVDYSPRAIVLDDLQIATLLRVSDGSRKRDARDGQSEGPDSAIYLSA